jgi:hypothetical protein
MGIWLATVTFPDGARKYGSYHTVSHCVWALHPELDADLRPAGEPERPLPDAVPADDDALVPVVITLDRDGICWHALYCPNRRQLVLGEASHTAWVVNTNHVRALGADGRTHLGRYDTLDLRSRCGVPVAEPISDPNAPDDPFSHWFDPTWCRGCLRVASRDGSGGGA